MLNFGKRFQYYKSNGLHIDVAFDIGSYRGAFTQLLRSIWPAVKVWQFEADERQKIHNPEAHNLLLGDSQREVDFYTIDESTAPTTGSSIYRENTPFYRQPLIQTKPMTTIDALMQTMDFSGDWKEHGLIKIDTQGSEVDILKGAREFIRRFTPRAILLEASVIPYNAGAPLVADVFAYMKSIGYQAVDIFDLHYWPDGRLIQVDVYFEHFRD